VKQYCLSTLLCWIRPRHKNRPRNSQISNTKHRTPD